MGLTDSITKVLPRVWPGLSPSSAVVVAAVGAGLSCLWKGGWKWQGEGGMAGVSSLSGRGGVETLLSLGIGIEGTGTSRL